MSPVRAMDLTAAIAYDYLASRGLAASRIVELAGGVSNTVLLAETPSGRLVLKQSLPQLRVEQQWLSDRSRIWREAAALETVAAFLPAGSVPAVLFRDDDNFLFAMTAAPDGSESWKSSLLAGECDVAVAERVGIITAALIGCGFRSPEMQRAFGDLSVFDQLRLDPYYRTTSKRHPDLAGFFDALVEEYPGRACALVHGDWSPKNFLVHGADVMSIDYEAIHFGDPAFDAAFLLNHLLLKSFHLPQKAPAFAALAERFWKTLCAEIPTVPDFERLTVAHLGALLLCRIDGKSPVEYIAGADRRNHIREFARGMITMPPRSVLEVFTRCA